MNLSPIGGAPACFRFLARITGQLSVVTVFAVAMPLCGAPKSVAFSQSAQSIEAYDFIEVVAQVTGPDVKNPFLDASFTGSFVKAGQNTPVQVTGFCDSADGNLLRIRFMPVAAGDYSFSVEYAEPGATNRFNGAFQAVAGRRRGPVRVDPKYPWHFIWEGTGEHYFFNGTTAFWLMGWREEHVIRSGIERLHSLKINRLRVLLDGAANIFWGEPVMTGENFNMAVRPWMARAPHNFEQPGVDYARFDVSYWQKWERTLRFARDRDMIISVIMDISTHQAQAPAGSEEEKRYFRYAASRLGAFSNITWDLGDDLDSFRDEKWAHEMGTFLVGCDPNKHLATSHPVHREHQDRTAEWFGFTSIQDWSRQQHELMLDERRIQSGTRRIIPQTNEEYGYEDHYPQWAPGLNGDSSETLRRVAWDIAMAGAYGTAGETARRGVNIWPDTGGGWVNGRGDDTMVMLKGYEHMVDFFTSFDWWKTEPHDELVSQGCYCLAAPGEIYAVYLPSQKKVTVRLDPGTYEAQWFNAFTGEAIPLPAVHGPQWTSPQTPGWLDWALLLKKSR